MYSIDKVFVSFVPPHQYPSLKSVLMYIQNVRGVEHPKLAYFHVLTLSTKMMEIEIEIQNPKTELSLLGNHTPFGLIYILIKLNSNISCYWNCAGPIVPNQWLAAHGPV